MTARNSCLSRKSSVSIRSCVSSNQREQRRFTSCRALHAVLCIVCRRFACAYRPTTSRSGPGIAISLMKLSHGHRWQQTISDLLEGAAGSRAIAEERPDAQHPLAPDRCNFHESAVPHLVGDRIHSAVREIHVRDARAVLLKRLAGSDRVHPQMLADPVVVTRRGEPPAGDCEGPCRLEGHGSMRSCASACHLL